LRLDQSSARSAQGSRRGGPLAAAVVAAVAGVALACQEDLTAPGRCPEFCPPTEVQVVDSVFLGVVAEDSTFRGYVVARQGTAMQLVADPTIRSVGVIRFLPFPETVSSPEGSGPAATVDSLRLNVVVTRVGPVASGATVAVHRIPVTVDSSTSLDDLLPYLEDSTRVATAAVPEAAGDTLVMVLPGTAFPSLLTDDDRTAAVALALDAPEPTFIDVGTLERAQAATLERFVHVDIGDGATAEGSDAATAAFDTFVHSGLPDPAPGVLAVGGTPSARTLLRIALPAAVIDSSDIVRATLLLVPSQPALGAPGDSVQLRADRLAADFGPKSPVDPTEVDTLGIGTASVRIGSVDTTRLDITPLVRAWQLDSRRPRALMLRVTPEGAGLAEVRFNDSDGASPPGLHLTYVPLGPLVKR
jgi:hypothetical protein